MFVCVFCFRCSLPHSGALCPLSSSVLCSGLLSPLAFLGLVAHIREEEERSADPEVAANEPRAAGGHNGSGRGVVDKAVCRSVALRAMREEINNSVGHFGLLSA